MAVLAPTDQAMIEVTGSDRASHLDAVTTQRLDDARPGEVRGAMVLDPKGSPQAMCWVVVHAERFALLADPASADHLMEVVAQQTFLADIAFERDDVEVWSLRGPGLGAILDQVGVTGLTPGNWRAVADGMVVRHPFGAEVVGEGLVDRLGELDEVELGDPEALRFAQVEVGEPSFGCEVVAGRLPEEVGLLPTHVHLEKGCYPGQEAVARMWMLGRPRRRLAVVELAGAIDAGWTTGSGRQKVEVTAATGQQGLAFVPPDTAVGDTWEDDGESVTVAAFVGGDAFPPGHDPSMTRRRDAARG